MILTFRFEGNTPSKKNQKQILRGKEGRPFITASTEFKKWHGPALLMMKAQRSAYAGILFPIAYVPRLVACLYYETRHRRDASNTFESIADLLVDAEILADDNWCALPSIGIFSQLRPGRPGWEVRLTLPEAAPGPAQAHHHHEEPKA